MYAEPFTTKAIQSSATVTFAAKRLIAVRNVSGTAQTVTLKIYDSPTASGRVIDDVPALNAEAIVPYPAPGEPVTTGYITVVPSGSPVGDGFELDFAVDQY